MTSNTMIDRRLLLGSLAGLAIPAAARAKPADYPALQIFLDTYFKTGRLSGGVIAIKRGNTPVDYICAGTLAFDTPTRTAPDTLYRVYSMTKPITGMAAMRLVQDRKLRLDQPIFEILPEFRNMRVTVNAETGETRPAAGPILIRHLLTHTSGLSYAINTANNRPTASAALYNKNGITPGSRLKGPVAAGDMAPAADLEAFGKRLATLPLDFDPGTQWQYSVALDLMGLIIQRVSGMSFHDYLRRTFFEPLRMVDTDFMVPASKLDRFTSVYNIQNGAPTTVSDDRKSSPFARDRDLPSGGGGLVSTARDYCRFTTMLMNEGSLDGVRVLRPEIVRLARSNLMPDTRQVFGRRSGYGAAMQVIPEGGQIAGQDPAGTYSWGGAAGTIMWIDPVNRVNLVMMVQYMPQSAYRIGAEARVAAYKDLAALGALKSS